VKHKHQKLIAPLAPKEKYKKDIKNKERYFYLFLLVFTYFSFGGLPQ
jgi:hypothetical protein